MIEAYKKYWKGYTKFGARTSRRDYWLAFLMNLIVSFVIGLVCGLIFGGSFSFDANSGSFQAAGTAGIIIGIWGLLNILPSLANNIRRLHDTKHSGWWIFITLIPLGFFVLLYFLCIPSVESGNKYPKH